MPIAWRTDYAMRIMYELARLGDGGKANVGELSETSGVPYDFARQIANRLAHEGLLVSRRGAKGGFLLARGVDEITLLDVFVAMGEKPTISLCTHDDTVCRRTDTCPMHHGVWLPIDSMIATMLGSMTLAGAVAKGDELCRELTRAAN